MKQAQPELEYAISKLLTEELHLKKGENLLLYSDKGSDLSLVNHIYRYAKRIGIHAELLQLDPFPHLSEMANALLKKVDSKNYDSICELSQQYFYPTVAWKTAKQKGSRIFSLGPLSGNSLVRCLGNVDNQKMYRLGLGLYERLNQAKIIRIFSEQGTEMKMHMGHFKRVRKLLSKYQLAQESKVFLPSGRFRKPRGSATFLGGQLTFIGLTKSIKGTAVIDGHFWPPQELGPLKNQIKLYISKGHVMRIDNDSSESESLKNWLEGKPKCIEHFCIGFNPGAKMTGSLLEAERTFGSLVIGIGKYPFHTDGIIKNPVLEVDHKVILKDNTFITEPLYSLSQELLLR